MRRWIYALLAVPLPVVTAIPATAQDSRLYVESAQLDPENAVSEAQSDYKKGICRLYAVAGYTWEIPGLSVSARGISSRYEIIYISDTSDARSSENEAANKRADAYAKAYNLAAVANCGAFRE